MERASAAFARARRWPGARRQAEAGRELCAARSGHALPGSADPFRLAGVSGEALVLSALAAGRLDAGAALARLMRRTGDRLGPLYEAACALEAGDESAARRAAAASAVPLAVRGIGVRTARALAAREAGARTLVLDRSGELVATVDAGFAVHGTPETAPLVPGALERLRAPRGVPALRLAVDLELSRAARDALGAARGSIVLVDARSGAVRAAVSDARTAAALPDAPFAERREPASIAKLLTAAAAYREGLDPDAEIARMTCTGVERYGGRLLWCPFPGGRLAGLDDALAQSCNIAFANLGTRLGARALLDEYRRWGFGGGFGTLAGDAGRVHTAPRTPLELAFLSVGLELVDVTPLHAALLAAVVANDGRMAEPRLVTGPCGPLGLTGSEDRAPVAREVIDAAVARRLLQAMVAVARSGTGAGLAPPGFEVAMKTGTGAERASGYHVNYIGVALSPGARLAFCVRVTHEPTSPAVTRVAREVTRRLLLALADHRGRLSG